MDLIHHNVQRRGDVLLITEEDFSYGTCENEGGLQTWGITDELNPDGTLTGTAAAGPRLTAVFIDHPGAWTAAHGTSGAQHTTNLGEASASGQLLRSVTAYDDGGTHRFAAVWTLGSIPGSPAGRRRQSRARPRRSHWLRMTRGRACAARSTAGSRPRARTLSSTSDSTRAHLAGVRRRPRRPGRPVVGEPRLARRHDSAGRRDHPSGARIHLHQDQPSARTDERIHVVGWVTVTVLTTDGGSGVKAVTFRVNGDPAPLSAIERTRDGRSFRFTPAQAGNNEYVISVEVTDAAGNVARDKIAVTGVRVGRP